MQSGNGIYNQQSNESINEITSLRLKKKSKSKELLKIVLLSMITSVVAYLGFEFGEKQTTNSVVHEKPHVASINIDYNI